MVNKNKKELVQEINNLMKIIAFYIDEDLLINGQEKILEEIKKRNRINEVVCKLSYALSLLLLCAAFYLLGLVNYG